MAANISFMDIQAFLILAYNNTPNDELAQKLEPNVAYKFPNGKIEWRCSNTGILQVNIKVKITNNPLVFTWPPSTDEGHKDIAFESSTNGFKIIDKGGGNIRTDKNTMGFRGYHITGGAIAYLNVSRGRVLSVQLIAAEYSITVRYFYELQ